MRFRGQAAMGVRQAQRGDHRNGWRTVQPRNDHAVCTRTPAAWISHNDLRGRSQRHDWPARRFVPNSPERMQTRFPTPQSPARFGRRVFSCEPRTHTYRCVVKLFHVPNYGQGVDFGKRSTTHEYTCPLPAWPPYGLHYTLDLNTLWRRCAGPVAASAQPCRAPFRHARKPLMDWVAIRLTRPVAFATMRFLG